LHDEHADKCSRRASITVDNIRAEAEIRELGHRGIIAPS
jgi:hypothetical protein